MSKCCDPCPWCGKEVDIEEFYWGDDYGFFHSCPDKENCGWDDVEGRD